MANFDTLKRRKAGKKGALTCLIKDLDAFLQTATEDELDARLRSMENQVRDIRSITEQLAELFSSDEEYVKEVAEDTVYLESMETKISGLKRRIDKTTSTTDKGRDYSVKQNKTGSKTATLKTAYFFW